MMELIFVTFVALAWQTVRARVSACIRNVRAPRAVPLCGDCFHAHVQYAANGRRAISCTFGGGVRPVTLDVLYCTDYGDRLREGDRASGVIVGQPQWRFFHTLDAPDVIDETSVTYKSLTGDGSAARSTGSGSTRGKSSARRIVSSATSANRKGQSIVMLWPFSLWEASFLGWRRRPESRR